MAKVDVIMPQMGESIAEGTVTKWLKNVGDPIERDEPLFEISTDKVDAEIPSPAAGVLLEIRGREGDTVEVNTIVAVIDTGVDTSHPNLQGTLVDEACFASGPNGPSGNCPNGGETDFSSGAGLHCTFHGDCFHGTHVAFGVLWLLTLLVKDLRRPLRPDQSLKVEIAGLYWHFVDIVWIVIFTFVYLIPAIERFA